MSFSILAALLVAALLGGGAGGWRLTQMHYEHVISEAKAAQEAQQESARLRDHAAASSYEATKAVQRVRTITVTREVANAVQSDPECSSKPLPVSLRAAFAAAASNPDKPIPDRPMSAASSASPFDLGGLSARIFGHPGGTVGLPSQTEGTR